MLYAPFPPDMGAIAAIVRAVAPKPVNVLTGPADRTVTVAELREAGVRRISLGSAPYRYCLGALSTAAGKLAGGDLGALSGALGSAEVDRLLSGH